MKNLLKIYTVLLFISVNQSYSTDTPYYNFGIQAGLGLSSFDSHFSNVSVDPAIRLYTSGYYSKIFYLNIGIAYIIRSGRLNDIVVITPPYESSTPIYKWDYKFTISYFQFNLGTGFYIFNNFSVLGGAGISIAALNVSAEKTKNEFLYYYDPVKIASSRYYYLSGEGAADPHLEISYFLGFRYDLEKFFFEINYMRDFFPRDALYNIDDINSTLGSIFFTIGYNFFYHVTK